MSNYSDDTCLNDFTALETTFLRGQPNIAGLVSVLVFYVVILAIGVYASWRAKAMETGHKSEDVMLAGRNIGLVVGVFTMTATWVGGGYINGTAEYVFTPGYGLVWCQAPVGYAISLVLGGVLFARKMRDAGYVTMLDPFQIRYGRVMAALLYIPALLGDIFWSGAILSALGASLSVIAGINHIWAVIISAAVAVVYTFIGGLFSVAYTDVIQLIFTFIGLWLAIPFALMHPAVTNIAETAHQEEGSWLGSLNPDAWIGNYIDTGLLLIFGGIPWQVYFQRVLSQKTSYRALLLSIIAGFGCLIMAIPSVLIGAIAKSTDWNATAYRDFGAVPVPSCDYSLALPMVMQFLTPTWVSVIGLGAVSAAVMSSADSSILSSSAMFARNIYTPLRDAIAGCCNKKKATETEVLWVMRVSVIFVGAAAVLMAILVQSVYGLWYLCADLIYAMLFPQLVCVIHLPNYTNSYGSLVGFCVGAFFRLSGGEPLLSLPPLIKYPWYDEESGYQLFPFKTMTMLISLVVIIAVSQLVSLCCVGSEGQECGDQCSPVPGCLSVDSVLFRSFTRDSYAVKRPPPPPEAGADSATEDGVPNPAYDADHVTNVRTSVFEREYSDDSENVIVLRYFTKGDDFIPPSPPPNEESDANNDVFM